MVLFLPHKNPTFVILHTNGNFAHIWVFLYKPIFARNSRTAGFANYNSINNEKNPAPTRGTGDFLLL